MPTQIERFLTPRRIPKSDRARGSPPEITRLEALPSLPASLTAYKTQNAKGREMTHARWISVIMAGIAATMTAGQASAQEAHAHIGHVMTAWPEAPDGNGLLIVAQGEAAIALQHAEYALANPTDLDSIRLHSGHVLHAIDPTAIDGGPGLGYGLEKAASGVVAHIGYAAASSDASDNVKTHAEHVAASARNATVWSVEILSLIRQIEINDDSKHANIMAGRVKHLLVCVVNGCDANQDGTISWASGEGGLAQASQHMQYMMQGEGLD